MSPVFKRLSVLVLCTAIVLPQASLAKSVALEPAMTPADFAQSPDYLTQSNFQAPKATDCKRPIQTRETGTRPQIVQGAVIGRSDKEKLAMPSTALSIAPPTVAAVAPAAPMAAPATRNKIAVESSRMADASSKNIARSPSGSSGAAVSVQPTAQPNPPAIVTAGVIDDNADFGEYLAFKKRTNVVHRPRDVSERYLLEVRDAADKAVHDAQVRITSPQGYAMWARTDTAGQVWIHPKAFIPAQDQASVLEVQVEKQSFKATSQLVRGQKSAVQIKLDRASAQTKAQLDLVFLIDATGSMGDEIDKLKSTLRTIVSDIAKLPSQPDLCLGMVAYRDKGDEFLLRSHDFTNDINSFQTVLNALQAGGGGDYPEAMNEALHDAVHSLSWRGQGATRLLVLLADAPPHLDYGGPQYDKDSMAALGKGIKIFSVGASGLDKQGEFIQRQMAQYTGGRFVFLTYSQATNPASGAGKETVHDVQNYSVDTLDKLIVRLVKDELSKLQRLSRSAVWPPRRRNTLKYWPVGDIAQLVRAQHS